MVSALCVVVVVVFIVDTLINICKTYLFRFCHESQPKSERKMYILVVTGECRMEMKNIASITHLSYVVITNRERMGAQRVL